MAFGGFIRDLYITHKVAPHIQLVSVPTEFFLFTGTFPIRNRLLVIGGTHGHKMDDKGEL